MSFKLAIKIPYTDLRSAAKVMVIYNHIGCNFFVAGNMHDFNKLYIQKVVSRVIQLTYCNKCVSWLYKLVSFTHFLSFIRFS